VLQTINNGITAPLRQQTAMLLTDHCHITLSFVKNPPHAMRLLSEFFDHFLFLYSLFFK